MRSATIPAPRTVVVVGAGIVGLSTAWFLQEHGVEVTVVDRTGVAAGASWGNAGWLMTGDVTPLPSPDMLRQGVRGLLSTTSALRVPFRGRPERYWFLLQLARSCTADRWETSLHALQPLSHQALAAYDALITGGVAASVSPADHHLAVFTALSERDAYARHLEHMRQIGAPTEFAVLDAAEAQAASPVLSEAVVGAVDVLDQHYLDATEFLPALAASVLERGGRLVTGAGVRAIRDIGRSAEVLADTGSGPQLLRADAVVACAGVGLPELVRRFGVTVPLRAGRGYSFSVGVDDVVDEALYLPSAHVAATPWQGRLRMAGTMEFTAAGAPLDRSRVEVMKTAVRPLLRNVDLDDVRDEWVGARPVTADGRPLAGPTSSGRIWVVGGHAMEGMVLGPVTARLAVQGLVTGQLPAELRPFDPLR